MSVSSAGEPRQKLACNLNSMRSNLPTDIFCSYKMQTAPCALTGLLTWCCWAGLGTSYLHPGSQQATCCPCRLGRLIKSLDHWIAGATARTEAAETERTSPTAPAVATQWEDERRQAAAEEEDLREQKADVLEFMLDAPGERSSLARWKVLAVGCPPSKSGMCVLLHVPTPGATFCRRPQRPPNLQVCLQ